MDQDDAWKRSTAPGGGDAGSDDGGEFEELSVGGWHAASRRWLRHRWQIRIGLLLAFCLAFGLGVAGSYGWMHRRQRLRPRIDASISQTQQSRSSAGQVPIEVQLHNDGKQAVKIEEIRLSRPGFTIASGGLDGAETLDRHDSTEILYQLSPDCGAKMTGPATVRARVHTHGRESQWITRTIPQAPSDVIGDNLSAHRFAHCSEIGGVELTTRHASTSGNTLTLHVRLAVASAHRPQAPEGVRLRKLSAGGETQSIRVSFIPARAGRRKKSTGLPASGTVHIRVKGESCYASLAPMSLDAAVVASSGRSGDAYVNYDAKTAARLLDFTAKRCG